MNTIQMKAYAKINLSLDIIGKRDNGYHDVEMIMQQVTLHDLVTITKQEKDITIETDCYFIPSNSNNIACKIAEDVLNQYNIKSGIHIEIKKVIPVAAGLAGGSADAAAVIKGLNTLFDLKMTLEEMAAIAVKHGADIPFCIYGGAAVARGIGEELQAIPTLEKTWIVLCKPAISVSTQGVYKRLKWDQVKSHPNTPDLLSAIVAHDKKFVATHMVNVLEEVTIDQHPIIDNIKKKMREYGAYGSMMSGSGPTVFGIFKNHKTAQTAFRNLKKKYKQVFLVETYNGGSRNE